jgi:hypothetical protein
MSFVVKFPMLSVLIREIRVFRFFEFFCGQSRLFPPSAFPILFPGNITPSLFYA